MLSPRYLPQGLLSVVIAVFAWSAIHPSDGFTWLLEVMPVLIALPLILWLRHAFPLSRLLLLLLAIHAVILMVGGHYTYAEVPWFNGLRDHFHWDRNYYDRVGHVAQGFVPALLLREVFFRKQVVSQSAWSVFIITCMCLGFSAFYELIEWWVAISTGTQAEAFLATQGDVWDTQWDMCLALLGALFAQLSLAKVHDRSMAALE
ncbi:MAG TPA: DUF2238 domain-containing protein [Methylophilus sp.]